jgi:hypothetical protein
MPLGKKIQLLKALQRFYHIKGNTGLAAAKKLVKVPV